MKRRRLALAALLGVLVAACGKVGPPVRVRSEATAAGGSESAARAAGSEADESEEKEKQP